MRPQRAVLYSRRHLSVGHYQLKTSTTFNPLHKLFDSVLHIEKLDCASPFDYCNWFSHLLRHSMPSLTFQKTKLKPVFNQSETAPLSTSQQV